MTFSVVLYSRVMRMSVGVIYLDSYQRRDPGAPMLGDRLTLTGLPIGTDIELRSRHRPRLDCLVSLPKGYQISVGVRLGDVSVRRQPSLDT